ncbi:DinB family protein [Janibacter alittae]|uniref:DinB family protein n=1 Tax=Janibacter alittae TaxID=3115209 RepID=A0ABZ2MIF5_9MICO
MTLDLDEHGRPEPPLAGNEWETLTGFLDYQRATFEWKSANLTSAQLARRLPPTSMTMGGLMKHLAYVEDDWFGRWLQDEPRREPWASVDWTADPDWDWHSARFDDPDATRALWQEAVIRARTAAESAFKAGGLDYKMRRTWPDGRAPSLRWVITHMIEEYARHNGHADLLRESVDGTTGE